MSPLVRQNGPISIRDYVTTVESVLPRGSWREALGDLKISQAEQARPEKGESFLSWIGRAATNDAGQLPLTVVVGETASSFRQQRQPQTADSGPLLNMASTCDGVAAMRAMVGLLHQVPGGLESVDFDAVIDEWAIVDPRIPNRAKNSHLLVVGTPEVNVFACFLHGMVQDFHFGQRAWPPDLKSMGDRMYVAGQPYLRCPGGDKVNHCGAVVLMKNPWNPRYRVLWIGGLSGRGTALGCSLIASGWRGHGSHPESAIGVVFNQGSVDGGRQDVKPRRWLQWNGGAFGWRAQDDEPISPLDIEPVRPSDVEQVDPSTSDRKARFDVFLSYHQRDRKTAQWIKRELQARRVEVWYDQEQVDPGDHWMKNVDTGIRASANVVVLVGSSGLGPWETQEVEVALLGSDQVVIPVLLPGAPPASELPSFLRIRHALDLESDNAIERLVKAVTPSNPSTQRSLPRSRTGASVAAAQFPPRGRRTSPSKV